MTGRRSWWRCSARRHGTATARATGGPARVVYRVARRPLPDHRRSPRGGDRRWRPRRRVGLRQRHDRRGSGRGPLRVHRGDGPVDARPEPRLPDDPRRRRRQERRRRGHRRAGRQRQVDAGDGLRATRVRRLRRGRGLRARPAGLDRAVGDAVDPAAPPRRPRRCSPRLAGIEGRRQPNGEVKLEVDLDAVFPGRAVPCAPAGPIVELVRGTGGPTRIEPIDGGSRVALAVGRWLDPRARTRRRPAGRPAALPAAHERHARRTRSTPSRRCSTSWARRRRGDDPIGTRRPRVDAPATPALACRGSLVDAQIRELATWLETPGPRRSRGRGVVGPGRLVGSSGVSSRCTGWRRISPEPAVVGARRRRPGRRHRLARRAGRAEPPAHRADARRAGGDPRRGRARAGIEVMPLKGALLTTMAGPEAAARPMADLDLLVHPADRAGLGAVLAALGYRHAPEANPRPTHDVFLDPGGGRIVSFEGEHPDNPRRVEVHVEVKRHLWGWVDDDDLTRGAVGRRAIRRDPRPARGDPAAGCPVRASRDPRLERPVERPGPARPMARSGVDGAARRRPRDDAAPSAGLSGAATRRAGAPRCDGRRSTWRGWRSTSRAVSLAGPRPCRSITAAG